MTDKEKHDKVVHIVNSILDLQNQAETYHKKCLEALNQASMYHEKSLECMEMAQKYIQEGKRLTKEGLQNES